MAKKSAAQIKHDEMTKKILEVVDYLNTEEFNYMILVGKEGLAGRYVNGSASNLIPILVDSARKDEGVRKILQLAVINSASPKK